MNLLTFRIIGHPAIPNAPWIKVGNGLNIFKAFDAGQAKALLKMLQAINPPYNFENIDPFQDLPLYSFGHPYVRKIIPSKKTAAIAIFAASLRLVKELAAIDPLFFQTDRIEFGRRRDQSQWINFVELSSTTRWNELESTVRGLLSRIGADAVSVVGQLQNTMANLLGTDRIKGNTAVDLQEQLAALRRFTLKNEQALLDQCLHAVGRAERFRQAKKVVTEHIPIFLTITGPMLGSPVHETEGTSADDTSSALFDFFLKRQGKNNQAEQLSLKQRLQQINLRLQTSGQVPTPHFREEETSIILETTQNSVTLPFTEMLPVCRMKVLLSALAALHKEFYGYDPIFLIDIREMKLARPDLSAMFSVLLRLSLQWQCLVLPNSEFLAFYLDNYADEEDKQHLITLIDVTTGG